MVKRDLGTRGYYSRPQQRREERRDSLVGALALVILFVFFLLLFQKGYISLPGGENGGLVEPTEPVSPGLQRNATPSAPPTVSPTPYANATPYAGSNASVSRYLYNVTIGPYNISISNTTIQVTKYAWANESNYSEKIVVENVGKNGADFFLVDVVPESFNLSVDQVDFFDPEFETVSPLVASFSRTLAAGEKTIQGPDNAPVYKAHEPMATFFISSKASDEAGNVETIYDLYSDEPYVDLTKHASEILSFDPGDYDYAEGSLPDAQEFFDERAFQHDITNQIGRPIPGPRGRTYNYSNLTQITIYVSENKPVKKFSIPLAGTYETILFKFEKNLTNYAEVTAVSNGTSMIFTFNFSRTALECGKFPFEELNDILNFTLPGAQKFYTPRVTVIAMHNDLGDYSLPQTSCADVDKVLKEARKHVGKPYIFSCPNPPTTFSCACFVVWNYKHSVMPGILDTAHSATLYSWLVERKYKQIKDPKDLKPGDILFFITPRGIRAGNLHGIGHSAIYYGDGKIIHAQGSATGVVVTPYYGNLHAGVRVIDCDNPGASGDSEAEKVDVYKTKDPFEGCVPSGGAACGEKSAVQTPPVPAGCRSFGGVSIDTIVSRNKFYYATYFGCSGGQSDPGDNCIGACSPVSSILTTKGVKKLDTSSGRAYEDSLEYFSANKNQYGCNARLKVTNPITGQAVVVKPTDAGPGCQVQTQGVKFDMSWVAQKAIGNPHIVKVEKVADTTPIGPVAPCP